MSKYAKRHYEDFARIMQEMRPHEAGPMTPQYSAQLELWLRMRNEIAAMFAGDNGLFKRERFMDACVPGANVRARS